MLMFVAFLLNVGLVHAEKMETLQSPSGNIRLEVTVCERLTYSAFLGEEQLLKDCPLSLQVGKEVFGENPRLSDTKRKKIDEVIKPATNGW